MVELFFGLLVQSELDRDPRNRLDAPRLHHAASQYWRIVDILSQMKQLGVIPPRPDPGDQKVMANTPD
jgi:hypothetical protein